ncbi:hypothetical protein ACIBM4_27035 [Streptomyces sp. NPDC050256]|uniref:hypothetical protein n=1 Tax=Streptomyces sp. NPDC050256 TaxID=3365607 RepID=UPI00379832CD
MTECSIHLVTEDGDKPFAAGFAEAGRPGPVAWRDRWPGGTGGLAGPVAWRALLR